MWIFDLVVEYEPRPDRTVSIERFSKRVSGSTELPVARGNIIDHEISPDYRTRLAGRDVPALAPDHNPQLGLVVHLFGNIRLDDVVIRTGYAGHLLVEPDLKGRRVHSGLRSLGSMIAIVHADTEEFFRLGNGRQEPRIGERDPGIGPIVDCSERSQRGDAL